MSQKNYYKHPQFQLRMPEHLKEIVRHVADKASRSMNAELIARITETISEKDLIACYEKSPESAENLSFEEWRSNVGFFLNHEFDENMAHELDKFMELQVARINVRQSHFRTKTLIDELQSISNAINLFEKETAHDISEEAIESLLARRQKIVVELNRRLSENGFPEGDEYSSAPF